MFYTHIRSIERPLHALFIKVETYMGRSRSMYRR